MIGTTLYVLAHSYGRPLRERFRPGVVTGETRASWILEGDIKVDRKTMKVRKGRFEYCWVFTADQVEDEIWRQEHRSAILRLVERADGAVLRQIAALIGYEG